MIDFSILLVTYNRPRLLLYTLKSLSLQTYRHFTVYLVDNGSQPPVDLASLPDDLDIVYTRFDSNQHPTDAANEGLKQIQGTHFLLLADDDVLVPGTLEVVARIFSEKPEVEALGVGFSYFDHDAGRPLSDLPYFQGFKGSLERYDARKAGLSHCSFWGIGPAVDFPRPRMAHPSASFFSRELIERTVAKQGELYIKPLGDVGYLGCSFNTDYVYHLDVPLVSLGKTRVSEMGGARPGHRQYWKRDLPFVVYSPVRAPSHTNMAAESHLKLLHCYGVHESWDCSLRPDFFLRHLEQVISDDPWTAETEQDIEEAVPFAVESLMKYEGLSAEAALSAVKGWLSQQLDKIRLQRTTNGEAKPETPKVPETSPQANIVNFAIWQQENFVDPWFKVYRDRPGGRSKMKENSLLKPEPHIPITFLVGAYNEEQRIRFVLESAIPWADEIIVVNKSSTDRTRDICLEYGDRVRVIDVPYSPQGHDDVIALSKLPTNDWIYFATASEIQTRKLIARIRQILSETRGELDLVYVPRKYYSFGIHDRRSPWSLSYFPFLVNRKKAIITNTVHHNFRPRDPQNVAAIEYSDDCCVYHPTHTTAKGYLRAMTDYFEAEVAGCEDPVAKIQECFANIAQFEKQLRQGGDELLGHYFAWNIYWMGTALFAWEKWRGVDVNAYYQQLRQEVLQREWLQHAGTDAGRIQSPLTVSDQAACKTTPSDDSRPLVSAIVSAYNAERFIRGCLEDLEAQTIAGQLEIIVVDSGSQQNERAIVEEFQQRYDNIVYIRTEEREGVYAAWNRGIRAVRGKYITNANTDDRHRKDAFERMVNVLEARPDIALVYANLYITETENETFENHTPVGAFRWLDFDPFKLIYGCFIGPQPMWRRSLHDKYGYFDESFESAGDWEFWLRIAESEKFLHLDEFLGLYLKSPTSVEHRDRDLSVREAQRVHQRYLPRVARLQAERSISPSISDARTLGRETTWVAPATERVENDGDLTDVEQALAELFAAGQAALDRDDLETAAGEFARVTEQAPDLAAGHTALGSTLMALDRTEEAVPALRRAAELAPQEPALHNQLGIALYQVGELEAAEEAFQAALRVSPADPSTGPSTSLGGSSGHRVDALLNLIEVYRAQDRYVEATECVKQAMQVAPNDVGVLTAFGTLSLELGDAEAARTALQHIQVIEPDQPVIQIFEQALDNA